MSLLSNFVESLLKNASKEASQTSTGNANSSQNPQNPSDKDKSEGILAQDKNEDKNTLDFSTPPHADFS